MKTMQIPTLEQIKSNYAKLQRYIYQTPILSWPNTNNSLICKCELFQKTGTFKIRGAITRVNGLTVEERKHGIVAGTGGNHGIAAALAAKMIGVHAKIIVPKTMNPFRFEKIRALGAEIILVDHIDQILDVMNEIAEKEKRIPIHPFDHPLTTLGTSSLGYEFLQQVPDLEVIIIPIGGGGLASGVSCAAKLINPKIKIYGVEPENANSMYLSFQQNHAVALTHHPESIADSLCSPRSMPYSYSVCKKFIDEIVLVSDDELRQSMKLLFEECKLACEAACAASTAAYFGPLKEKCAGKKTGLILCGSNIDVKTFLSILI